TVGQDAVFGVGQYAPESGTGQRLLAHELTHVVQQNGAAAAASPLAIAKSGDRSEREAGRVAEDVMRMLEPEPQHPCARGDGHSKCHTGQSEREEGLQIQERHAAPAPIQRMLQRFPDARSIRSPSAVLPPESDSELEALTLEEIERRARRLNSPYRPENAVRLLRLARAWEEKHDLSMLVRSASTDPLWGVPLSVIFGDLNTLTNDAARYPVPSRPHRRPSTRRRRKAEVKPITLEKAPPSPVTESAPEPPAGLSEAAEEIPRETQRMLTPSSETPERVKFGVEALGMGTEQAFSEASAMGFIGLGLEAVAIFLEYANTLIESVEKMHRQGELLGLRTTLVTLASLDE